MKGTRLELTLSPDLFKRLEQVAARRSLKPTELMRIAVSVWLEEQERQVEGR